MEFQVGLYPSSLLGIVLLVGGLVLFVTGISHRYTAVALWDAGVFRKLYNWLAPASRLFVYLWPLGTTPVAIVLIALFFIPNPDAGWITALVYLGMALMERLVKNRIRRPRPFQVIEGIAVQQPKIPQDASFPSGDAMRVWYIGLLLPAVFGLPVWVTLLTAGVAIVLSLGRIALGVHYPLDVIAGSAFGLLGSGLSLLLAGI